MVMKVIMKVVHEDEEITHFVGSKNIGVAQEKNNNHDNLEQAYIALWEDKIQPFASYR